MPAVAEVLPETRLRRRRAEEHRHAGGEIREDLVAKTQAPVHDRRLFARQPQVVALRQVHHGVRAARLVQPERQRRRRVTREAHQVVEVRLLDARPQVQFAADRASAAARMKSSSPRPGPSVWLNQ